MFAFTYNYKPYAWGWDIKLSQQRLWFNLLNKLGTHVDSYFHIEFLVQIVFKDHWDKRFQKHKASFQPKDSEVVTSQHLNSCVFVVSEWVLNGWFIDVLIIWWNISLHLFFIFSISSMLTSPWQSNMANFSGKIRFCVPVPLKHTVLRIEFYLMY